METRPYVPWDLMNAFLVDAFKGYGVPAEDASICADVLLESDRRGIESHGCNRFKPIYIDRIKNGTLLPVTNLEIIRETPSTLVMDAHDGMGMVASRRMMERLLEKAKACGMAGGAIRSSTHYGIAGYWSGMAAKEGMIGITGTNARPSIAPTFGVENMMGTNPLTFSLPTDEEFPFCIDCATSIVQRGKIEYYDREGLDTPAGMVVAQDGSPMTDSGAILRALVDGTAALAPLGGIGEELGGYKGYGYAAVVEILSAALAGGQFMKALTGVGPQGEPRMYGLGHFLRGGPGGLRGPGGVPEDRRGHLPGPAGLPAGAGLRADLHRRREGVSGLAGAQGQGRPRGGGRPAGDSGGPGRPGPALPVRI